MTEPYVGQIEIYGFSFAPLNWALAAGQLIAIQQNTSLFALIGTAYGGNGSTNFALPNLASSQACGAGQGTGGLTDREIGEQFGAFNVTLTLQELPIHNHGMNCFEPASPELQVPTTSTGIGTVGNGSFFLYGATGGATATMAPNMIQPAGGNQPHPNQQPYLGLNYSIALVGTFPRFN